MVSVRRQVPAPSAAAWLIDLSSFDGPSYTVLRLDEGAARRALREHLLDIGAVLSDEEAGALVDHAASTPSAVIW